MDEQFTEYNLQSLYDQQIEPLLVEMKKICKLNKLPFFIAIAIKNEKGKTKYVNDGVLTGSNQIELYDDMFTKFLMVMHGANVDYKEDLDKEALDYIMSEVHQENAPQTEEDDNVDEEAIDTIIDFVGNL